MRRICLLIATAVLVTSATLGMATSAGAATAAPAQSSPPAAPSNVTNQAFGSLDFYISWQVNSTSQTGFQIYNGATIVNVGPNTDYYEWAAQPGQYMCIAVRAVNASGDSAWAGMWTCTSTQGVQTPPAEGFTLSNYSSGQCLGVLNGGDNTWAVQGDCETPDQTWTVGSEYGSSGYYQVVNSDDQCLGVYSASTANNASVVGWQCLGTGHPDQYWAWVQSPVDSSYDMLVNYNSGQVLSVYDNLTSAGVQIVQTTNQNALNSQLWTPANQIDNANWSGYSLSPANGVVSQVYAKWTVPTVTCNGSDLDGTAAEWAGLWGTLSNTSQQWLPQIGTTEQCPLTGGTPQYVADWEMANPVGGYALIDSDGQWTPVPSSGSSAQQITTTQISGTPFTVQPGDTMAGEVDYLGSNSSGQRIFEIDLWNESIPVTSGGPPEMFTADIETSSAPSLNNIVNQGGVIVENRILGPGFLTVAQDFAQYSPPVSVTGMSVIFSEPTACSTYEYDMERTVLGVPVPSVLLAQNSGLTSGSTGDSFTVSWLSDS